MKILHALVGYLAVTSLSFHPFAFASPLAAIDYDGYVNLNTTQNPIDGALMKHLLDNIVGACQTVAYHGDYVNTTQNHRDSSDSSSLMKRIPGDVIEARLTVPLPIPIALIIVTVVATVVLSVLWVKEDDPVRGNDVEVPCRALWLKVFYQKREAFTQGVINQCITQYPQWNWVICHSPYNTNFDGAEGTDWGYTHHELRISFGRTIGSVLLLTYLQYYYFFSLIEF